MNIQNELLKLQDTEYRDFHSALMPTVSKDLVIGVRMPLIRKLAKKLWKESQTECMAFMSALPHKYYEENNLHAAFIQEIKDYNECITELEKFLPYIDNWATCDMLTPKALEKNREDLLERADNWISTNKEYMIRYGIGIYMRLFLDQDFKKEYILKISEIKSDKYYVNMMIAWYFATALAKQYESTVVYLEKGSLSLWIHNKTIQKAIESYRINDTIKMHLRSLRKKRKNPEKQLTNNS